MKQRALPGARRSNHGDQPPSGNLEVQSLKYRNPGRGGAIDLRQIPRLYDRVLRLAAYHLLIDQMGVTFKNRPPLRILLITQGLDWMEAGCGKGRVQGGQKTDHDGDRGDNDGIQQPG